MIQAAQEPQMSNQMYQRIIGVAQQIAGETDVHRLCSTLLHEAQAITGAQGGTLYLVGESDQGEPSHLDFVIIRNSVLNIDSDKVELPPLQLFTAEGQPNFHNVACHAYHHGKLINITDAYAEEGFDFSGTRRFDHSTGFRSKSFLTVPLIGDSGRVLGVFQLLNATAREEVVAFDPVNESAIQVLASFAAKALETQLSSQRRRQLLMDLSGTSDTNRLTEQILREARSVTNADGGALYMINDKVDPPQLEFSLLVNEHLNIYLGGIDGEELNLDPQPLYDEQGRPDLSSTSTSCALKGEIYNIADAYQDERFEFQSTRAFDRKHNYHSKSFLTVPLKNHDHEVIGVLQLINARDFRDNSLIPFSQKGEAVVSALSTYAAIALHNRILVQDLKALLDAFIQCIAQAIDAKSSHTSAHCQKVPLLMELIAQAACEDQSTFKDFQLDDDQWYEIKVASWLHDCGKLATPDSVLDKSTKLHLLNDGINEIQTRIAVMRQSIKLATLEKIAAQPSEKDKFLQQQQVTLETLENDANFLITANKGGEFMSKEAKARVQSLAGQQWQDANGHLQPLLSEREVEFLCIERGTLSQAERQVINDHMVVTIDMLESLPFPKKLRSVPEYAGGHHEKMDGTGFPKGLTRNQMSVPARMMAIADIFEALTSRDRPYKEPMKLSLALTILKRMREDDHIDPDLFELFIKSRVWEQYANLSLMDEQKDVNDISQYLQ